MEAMIGGLVDMAFMRHASFRESRIECWPSRRDARVKLGVLRTDGGLDLCGILRTGLHTIERDGSRELRTHLHSKLIDDATAEAEADRA
jgi:hypothetical protein